MEQQSEPTVFLVDDDPAMLRMLAKVTESLGLAASPYRSAEEFLAAYRPIGPACLVLDVRMPGMSGLELQRQLAAAGGALPVIFITAHADVRMAVEAMQQGAVAFLEKPFGVQELCDKIQAALRLAQDHWLRRQQRRRAREQLALLTPAESRVLHLLVGGLTNPMIAKELGLSVRTVEVHRGRIVKKLKRKSRIDLLRLVEQAAS